MSRSLEGALAVIIGEPGESESAIYCDRSVASKVQADSNVELAAAYTNPKCNNTSYNAPYLSKWIEPFPYYRKSGISIPLTAVQGGINAMANGTGTCFNTPNSAAATYRGTTSVSSTLSTGGLCGSTDEVNVVDAGILPSGTLAATCTYKTSLRISYADVRFNTARYTFFTGTATTGCSGTKYDAQGVMAHEAGHVFGLGHVADSTLQVMKLHSAPCEVTQRKLGAGDLAGMKHLYP